MFLLDGLSSYHGFGLVLLLFCCLTLNLDQVPVLTIAEDCLFFFLLNITFTLLLACVPCNMWDLSSLSRDWTCAPCRGSSHVNHWTAGKSWGTVYFFNMQPQGTKIKISTLSYVVKISGCSVFRAVNPLSSNLRLDDKLTFRLSSIWSKMDKGFLGKQKRQTHICWLECVRPHRWWCHLTSFPLLFIQNNTDSFSSFSSQLFISKT